MLAFEGDTFLTLRVYFPPTLTVMLFFFITIFFGFAAASADVVLKPVPVKTRAPARAKQAAFFIILLMLFSSLIGLYNLIYD